jgi:hypothetical protein
MKKARPRKAGSPRTRKKPSSADGNATRKQELDSDDLLPEYPPELIRNGTRGKYAERYAKGTNVVVLAPDVAAAFPDADSVNAALRALIDIARRQTRARRR